MPQPQRQQSPAKGQQPSSSSHHSSSSSSQMPFGGGPRYQTVPNPGSAAAEYHRGPSGVGPGAGSSTGHGSNQSSSRSAQNVRGPRQFSGAAPQPHQQRHQLYDGAGPSTSSNHLPDSASSRSGSGNSGESLLGSGASSGRRPAVPGQEDLGPYAHIPKGSAGQLALRKGRAQGGNVQSATGMSAAATGASLALPAPDLNRLSAMSSLSYQSYQSSVGLDGKAQPESAYVTNEHLLYDKHNVEPDDFLHNPEDKKDKATFIWCSGRGLANVAALIIVVLGLLALFAGYPIIAHYTARKETNKGGFNLGGSNGTGQVPVLQNLFKLIDDDTPNAATKWTHPVDGSNYHLVFSDEFEREGRTFWPGDDPFWEAVNIWYGVTGDLEWYSPEAVNTTNGYLQITMSEKITHDLYFQSGMVQSWNKFCFQGGYIEMSAILPGSVNAQGWWPGLWTMGNLGRPGYPGSTDGMWPYSYSSCDTGILKNQTNVQGTGPAAVLNANGPYSAQYNHHLSYLPGMRTPACTCAGGDHPGPNRNVGRGAPELDILEAQTSGGEGGASQSVQTAPFDVDYAWKNSSAYATLYQDTSSFNSYTGGVYQEAVSGVSRIPEDAYELAPTPRAVRFGVQYTPDWDGNGKGSVTWFIDGKATWKVEGAAVGPDSRIDIGQRLIPVEPMSIIMNFGMSNGFQTIKYNTLSFPATLKIDYVRVYQPDGQEDKVSCDPADHPTAQYIKNHPDLYANPNLTVFPAEKYGGWPKNKLTGC
ncbi:unnamed protein product [Parajaminaea phylloscopi]